MKTVDRLKPDKPQRYPLTLCYLHPRHLKHLSHLILLRILDILESNRWTVDQKLDLERCLRDIRRVQDETPDPNRLIKLFER
jgi:hypothetical protein